MRLPQKRQITAMQNWKERSLFQLYKFNTIVWSSSEIMGNFFPIFGAVFACWAHLWLWLHADLFFFNFSSFYTISSVSHHTWEYNNSTSQATSQDIKKHQRYHSQTEIIQFSQLDSASLPQTQREFGFLGLSPHVEPSLLRQWDLGLELITSEEWWYATVLLLYQALATIFFPCFQ